MRGGPLSVGTGHRTASTVNNYRARLVMGSGLLTHAITSTRADSLVKLSVLATTSAEARRGAGWAMGYMSAEGWAEINGFSQAQQVLCISFTALQ